MAFPELFSNKPEEELRKEIAKLFRNLGHDEIIVCGTGEGIFIAMNALLNAGDGVIVQTPYYQSLFELPKAIRIVTSRHTLRLGAQKSSSIVTCWMPSGVRA
jgi:aspartate/methionine/tyrosine aminotransferase